MPRRCTVCTHPEAHEINLAILRGTGSKRGIARHFGIDDASLRRHSENHLSAQLAGFRVRSAQDLQELNAEFERRLSEHRALLKRCSAHLPEPGKVAMTRALQAEFWSWMNTSLEVLRLMHDVIRHVQARHGARY